LATKTDVDWFTTVVALGKTIVTLSESTSPDVTMAIGAPVNGACALVLTGVRQAAVTAIHGAAPESYTVSSRSHALTPNSVSTSR
jgi:hypothetical protein